MATRSRVLGCLVIGAWLILSVKADEENIYPHGNGNFFDYCWEDCYQKIDGTEYERYRPAYKEFYEMGMEAKRLQSMRSANGTAFLIDSTLAEWHASDDANAGEEGEHIWQFQRDLATIMAIMLDSEQIKNPISITQFNHDSSWNCDTHTCLDCCQAAEILQTEGRLTPIEMDHDSNRDGNIEPACRLGYKSLHETPAEMTCGEICREFAIAFINSDFHHHVHAHDEWDDYSPCDEHFDTRLPIGTHATNYHELKEWASLDARPQYIKDNPYTFEAAEHLRMCMTTRCCTGSTPMIQSTTCAITTDHFGEQANSFADHPELATTEPEPPVPE